MKLVLVNRPDTEIITLEEAKNYLRVDHDLDDDLIKMLIKSTRIAMESIIQKSIMYQTWEYTVDRLPKTNRANVNIFDTVTVYGKIVSIPLPKSPIVKVISVKIGENELNPSMYFLKKADNKNCLIIDCKNTELTIPNRSIVIKYQSGISDSIENIPYQLKLANLILVSTAYQERYANTGNFQISKGIKQLLTPFINIRIS